MKLSRCAPGVQPSSRATAQNDTNTLTRRQKKIGGMRSLTARLDRGIRDLYAGLFITSSLSLASSIVGATSGLSQAALGMSGSGVAALANLIGYNPCWEGHELTWNAWGNAKRQHCLDEQGKCVAAMVLKKFKGVEENPADLIKAYVDKRKGHFRKGTNTNLLEEQSTLIDDYVQLARKEIQEKSYMDKRLMQLETGMQALKFCSAAKRKRDLSGLKDNESDDYKNFIGELDTEAKSRGLFHAWTVACAYFVTITAGLASTATGAAMWGKAKTDGLSTMSEVQAAGGSISNTLTAFSVLGAVTSTLSCLANADAAMLHRNALNTANRIIAMKEGEIERLKPQANNAKGDLSDVVCGYLEKGFSQPRQTLLKERFVASFKKSKGPTARLIKGFEDEYRQAVQGVSAIENEDLRKEMNELLTLQKELAMAKLNRRGADRRWYRSTFMSIAGATNAAGSVCLLSGFGAPFSIPLFGGGLLLTGLAWQAGRLANNNNDTTMHFNQATEDVDVGNLKREGLQEKIKDQFATLIAITNDHVTSLNKQEIQVEENLLSEMDLLSEDSEFAEKIDVLKRFGLGEELIKTLKKTRKLMQISSQQQLTETLPEFKVSERRDYWSKSIRVLARISNRRFFNLVQGVSLTSPNQRKLENVQRTLQRCRNVLEVTLQPSKSEGVAG